MRKSILTRINQINELLPQINNLADYVYTYDGGTWPYLIDINPIEVLTTKVKITNKKADKGNYILGDGDGKGEVYVFSKDYELDELNHTTKVILREFKKALKNN